MKTLILSLVLMLLHGCVFAYGNVWYDKDSALGKTTKIVIFPIEGKHADSDADAYLYKTLKSKVKGVYFYTFSKQNEKSQLLLEENQDNKYLQGQFADEKARGAAVEEYLAADAYIICKVREYATLKRISPEIKTTVTIKDWMEESGGPDGYKTWNETSHDEEHIVPEKEVSIDILELDFYMYDTQGNKIMLFNRQKQGYSMFEDIIKEYADEVKNAKKSAKGGK